MSDLLHPLKDNKTSGVASRLLRHVYILTTVLFLSCSENEDDSSSDESTQSPAADGKYVNRQDLVILF